MTVQTLTMPRLGETMEKGVIVCWHKAEGDSLRRGEPLVDIETDKTVAEFPALENGVLHKILAGKGANVPVGDPIAQIESGAPAKKTQRQPMKESEVAPTKSTNPTAQTGSGGGTRKTPGGKARATPAARAAARANDLDIEKIAGSGRGGRVELRDVEKMLLGQDESDAGLRYLQLDTGRLTGRLAYTATGHEGASACWLLLHGLGGDMTMWSAIAMGLARANCRVFAVDLPAHGKTEVEAQSVDDLVDAMCAFADTVPRRFHLVGLSLGGKVAVELARRRKDKVASAILVNTAGIGLPLAKAYVDGITKARSAKDVERAFKRLSPCAKAKIDDESRATLAEQIFGGRLPSLAAELCAAERAKQDFLPQLAQVSEQMPVKVVLGKQDEIIPLSSVPNLPPQVAVHLFAKAGHMLQLDEPGEFLNLLLAGMQDPAATA